MKKLFKRTFQSLDDIFRFIDEFINDNNLDTMLQYPVHLAVEEIFTNMVKYNNKSTKGISLELVKEGNHLVVRVTDHNGTSFKSEATPPYNTSLPLEERPNGKLGIHLVKKYMDDIQYEYTEDQSTVTFKKKLKDTHV